MAALLTVIAVIAGAVVGLTNGGSVERLRTFRPELWPALAGGLALQVLILAAGLDGGWAVVVELVSAAALIAFATANIRIGGMVLVVAGLSLNLIPTLVDWGIPTSRDALQTAGVIEQGATGPVALEGPRHVATESDWFTWLGETIALPTGQVISFGDVLLQFGYLFVTASVLRGRILRRDVAGDYPRRIAALGQGPMRRRGPGTHPARQDPATARSRRRSDPDDEYDDEYDDE